MSLDAIIVAAPGAGGDTGIIPSRLHLSGRPCSIQNVMNAMDHQGRIVPPVAGEGRDYWWAAYRLNGIYLLSYLMRKGFSVELVNKYFLERERFRDLLGQNPRSVIISTPFIRNKTVLKEIVDDMRDLAPDLFIIAGGAFVYASYLLQERALDGRYDAASGAGDYLFIEKKDPSVDLFIISGQGESILCDALERLRDSRPMDDLPNVAYRQGEGHAFTPRIDDISGTKDLPLVDWAALPDFIFESGVVPMRASRGCPYRCAFCNFVKDRRLLYTKPEDLLIQELKTVSQRGVRYIWFLDDNFRMGKRDMEAFCRRIIEESISLQWLTMIRASAIKGMDFSLLREAGCIDVQMGLESADPGILENMAKGVTPDVYREVVEGLLSAGIHASCYFIFGFPGETEETAMRTRRFIQEMEHPELEGTLSWTLFHFSLAPLSPIYDPDMRAKYGLTGYMDTWQHNTMDVRRAREHVNEAFMELDNSCPIYRGDNLKILEGLSPQQRKRFVVERHRLAKKALDTPPTDEEVLAAFSAILRPGG